MTRDLLKEAYGAMQHNRRRTTLTMLGMAWGIATVVILLAFGSGFERAINMIFSSWGTDVIGIFPGRTSLQAVLRPRTSRRSKCMQAKSSGLTRSSNSGPRMSWWR